MKPLSNSSSDKKGASDTPWAFYFFVGVLGLGLLYMVALLLFN